MNPNRCILMAAVCVLFAAAGAAAEEDTYHWPLDVDPVLTSSFGEYRPGRFHAGIDLRTYGIGQPVRAPADGEVVRVRTSPHGYGKALYIRLADGNTAVYAHLDRFASPVAEYVFSAQHERERYTVDLYPGEGEFPVERGEVVAYSGRTGVGAPHLHYEIRDPDNQPINPRSVGLTWPDTQAPEFESLLIAPRNPESTVGGDIIPQTRSVRRVTGNRYEASRVYASGEVGFAVDVTDRAEEGGFRLGVHTIVTEVDGEEVFRMENDVLSYDTINDGRVSFHPFYRDEGRFWLQWRWAGNRSPNFLVSDRDGWYGVGNDPATVEITAKTFMGNEASLSFELLPERASEPAGPASTPSRVASGDLIVEPLGEWLGITAQFFQAESARPVLLMDGAPAENLRFRRIGSETFRTGYDGLDGRDTVDIGVDHPRMPAVEQTYHIVREEEEERVITFEDCEIRVPGEAVYGVLFLRKERESLTPESPELTSHGDAFRLEPENMPLANPIEVTLPEPEDYDGGERLGVYRQGNEGWSYVSAEREDGEFRFSTRSLGAFMTIEDNTPPSVRNITIMADGSNPTARPTIRAEVTDEGSGLYRVDATVNGEWIIMRYDPELDEVIWEQDQDLPEGNHQLTIRARDRAGNEEERSRYLTVPVTP